MDPVSKFKLARNTAFTNQTQDYQNAINKNIHEAGDHNECRSLNRSAIEGSCDHPPLSKEPPGLYDTLIKESDLSLNNKKFIKVTSEGEVEMEPDQVEFCVKITTNKTSTAAAKESVKKRKDFLLAALKKLGIPECDVIIFRISKRIHIDKHNPNVNHQDRNIEKKLQINTEEELLRKNKLLYSEELCIKCNSLVVYLNLFTICNEKLDRHVEVSRPVVRFSPNCVQAYTQKAVRLAMSNGILKANNIITITNQRVTLGRLYYAVEDALRIELVQSYNNCADGFETFSWKSLNKSVKCEMSSVFELIHSKPRKII